MRAIWSGTLAFGLVALPVRLYPATEEQHVHLREIHAADASRVQHRRFCEAEDREIPYEEVGRGWELPDGRLVPLSEEDLQRLPLPTRHVADVLGFVPSQDIDPLLYSKPYYVAPGAAPGSDRPYALLVEALARTGYVGLCKIALRSRERLALLRPRHGMLVCQTLLWPDELRDPGDLSSSAPVTDRELQLAEVLVRELIGIDVTDLHDEYRHALEQLVTAKAEGGELAAPPEPPPAVDLMAALEESVRTARAGRGD
ncbi:non-homologous end joining protein Ku [Streptomyces sp. 24-1644]|uniref:non-homologous end joining protein Ku n=1 Tax=Streptomyces sp. 24-1644 TaxID=3457315 RepID=UPI003FA7E047